MIQQHGGNISHFENILDFSANINPLGIPESVKRAVEASVSEMDKYPDPYCSALRERLAAYEGIPADNIVCGNGADDLIFRIVHAFRPARAIVTAPSFSEYSRALAETGCITTEHILSAESGFELTEGILSQLTPDIDICFICSPNNPTGRTAAPDVLEKIAGKCLENNIILVCDECFLGFVQNGESLSLMRALNENCVILKAFTKLFAVPGIRLGYVVCGSISAAGRIRKSGQFWGVSSLAQTAGIAALGEKDYLRRTVKYVAKERERLTAEMRSMGIMVFESSANFLLFRSCSDLGERLLDEGILIRDCRNFAGLSQGYYRIAVRTHEENTVFLNALRRCLNG